MSDLTRQQLCAELSVSESTVRRWERDGLPCTPIGVSRKRYDLAEVKRWLKERESERAEEVAASVAAGLREVGAIMSAVFAPYEHLSEPPPEKVRVDRPALLRFHASKRRTAKLLRTPAWANLEAMKAIYAEANRLSASTGRPHHVDHVIPLQGKLVSGLHVHNNLQILTGSENSKKRNRFEIEP